jgi:hypothetical protein
MNRVPINYVKLQTPTNNPKISAKMRYSQLVNSKNSRTVSTTVTQRVIVPLTN